MSLSPIYVKCRDGKYYKNPVITDDKDFYICFDDDEPIEIVIFDHCKRSPEAIMSELEIKHSKLIKGTASLRHLKGKFLPAKSFFFIEIENVPVPNKHDGIIKHQKDLPECVLYT